MAATGITVSGRLTPLRFEILPATSTVGDGRALLHAPSRAAAACRRRSGPCGPARARTGSPDGAGARAWRRPASLSSSVKVWPLTSMALSPAKAPTRSFGPCRSARMAIGRLNFASTRADHLDALLQPVARQVAHVEAEDVRRRPRTAWRSSPGSRRPAQGRDDLGAPRASSWSLAPGRFGSVSWIVQLFCSPVSTSKKPLRSKPRARQSSVPRIVNSSVARAHEGASAPFAAAVVVDRVDVVEARRQRPFSKGLAGAGVEVPPALRDPALRVAVAEGDADPARGHVAQAQIRLRRRGGQSPPPRRRSRVQGFAAGLEPM